MSMLIFINKHKIFLIFVSLLFVYYYLLKQIISFITKIKLIKNSNKNIMILIYDNKYKLKQKIIS